VILRTPADAIEFCSPHYPGIPIRSMRGAGCLSCMTGVLELSHVLFSGLPCLWEFALDGVWLGPVCRRIAVRASTVTAVHSAQTAVRSLRKAEVHLPVFQSLSVLLWDV